MKPNQDISLTVLMPCYNVEKYVAQAIESVLAQTYTDFEFLIINDGSKDGTDPIIRSYADHRIRYICRENRGLIDTLNEGLAAAKGELIARMDADDICMPDRLQKQVDFLSANPDYVIIGGEANVIDKEGAFLFRLIPVGHTDDEIRERIDIRCPFTHPSVMFRKEAVIQAGGYPKNALTFEDHLLWKKLLHFGKVYNTKDILLQFRFNPESVTIDEKWRGPEFVAIRQRSIEAGGVIEEDGKRLQEIISSQNFGEYKTASYHASVGKKYLWDNPDAAKARKHLRLAIKAYPSKKEAYLLYLFSFIPSALRKTIYKALKRS